MSNFTEGPLLQVCHILAFRALGNIMSYVRAQALIKYVNYIWETVVKGRARLKGENIPT
jgi:hypothetical protein